MATLKARVARFEAGLIRNDDSSDDMQRAAPLIERLEAQIKADAAAGIVYSEPSCKEVAELRALIKRAAAKEGPHDGRGTVIKWNGK